MGVISELNAVGISLSQQGFFQEHLGEITRASVRLYDISSLSVQGAKLQVLLDHGWVDCGEDETSQIRSQVEGGEQRFSIQSRGAMYVVDFTDMSKPTQTNSQTKKTRELRIVTSRNP